MLVILRQVFGFSEYQCVTVCSRKLISLEELGLELWLGTQEYEPSLKNLSITKYNFY